MITKTELNELVVNGESENFELLDIEDVKNTIRIKDKKAYFSEILVFQHKPTGEIFRLIHRERFNKKLKVFKHAFFPIGVKNNGK